MTGGWNWRVSLGNMREISSVLSMAESSEAAIGSIRCSVHIFANSWVLVCVLWGAVYCKGRSALGRALTSFLRISFWWFLTTLYASSHSELQGNYSLSPQEIKSTIAWSGITIRELTGPAISWGSHRWLRGSENGIRHLLALESLEVTPLSVHSAGFLGFQGTDKWQALWWPWWAWGSNGE